jgi:hypothetical protein
MVLFMPCHKDTYCPLCVENGKLRLLGKLSFACDLIRTKWPFGFESKLSKVKAYHKTMISLEINLEIYNGQERI